MSAVLINSCLGSLRLKSLFDFFLRPGFFLINHGRLRVKCAGGVSRPGD